MKYLYNLKHVIINNLACVFFRSRNMIKPSSYMRFGIKGPEFPLGSVKADFVMSDVIFLY